MNHASREPLAPAGNGSTPDRPSAAAETGRHADEPIPRLVGRGTSAYNKISVAFFFAGFATFSLLYCVQPLLPIFSKDFGIGPAASSLAVSFSTGFLAGAILLAAVLAERSGRRSLMFASIAVAAGLNIAAAFAPNWPALLTLRALEGFALGGVPAVAMTYLAEEIEPRGLGPAMGLYIGGSALGGMMGRVATGILSELFSWRVALAVVGIVGLATAVGFIALVPRSRNFIRRRDFDAAYHWRAWSMHLRDPALPMLFIIGFVSMGTFVTLYNYAGYRLTAPPFNLDQTQLGLIFTVYLFGAVASPTAGALADRIGHRRVLPAGLVLVAVGALLTLPQNLGTMICGIVIVTIGFFITHTIASAWVGRLAQSAKGHAASLYLLAYYIGSSVLGSTGGWFMAAGGWPATIAFTLVLLAIGFAASLRLYALTRAR
jgi:MFS transporter, YNFM family, putative membrane transport protein